MDGVGLVEEYVTWVNECRRGDNIYASPMASTHDKIAKILDKGRYSFEEVVELLVGIIALRYCQDKADARVAIGLFADKLLQMIGKDRDDEDGEMVDRIDAGGW